MSEMLLGQNVALIYKFIEQAVKLHEGGEHWRSLDMLRIAGGMVYKDKSGVEALDDLKKIISDINERANKVTAISEEQRRTMREDQLNHEAGKIFVERLEALRDYMQKVGYYTMMNKGWSFYDLSGGRKSE